MASFGSPLGVIGVRPHTLEETADHRGLTAAERNRRIARTPREQKLSSRWEKLVKTVGERLPSGTRAIHVMDREADQYPLFAEMLEDKASFVIRGAADRRLYGDANTSVVEALSSTPASLLRTVRINQKSKSDANPQHPERLERDAILSIRFGTVTFRKQSAVQSSVHEITVNAVHVFEAAPTNGVDPIEWMLFTSEPVSSFESAADVVDHYRARWDHRGAVQSAQDRLLVREASADDLRRTPPSTRSLSFRWRGVCSSFDTSGARRNHRRHRPYSMPSS